jgi:hypothetical protein
LEVAGRIIRSPLSKGMVPVVRQAHHERNC